MIKTHPPDIRHYRVGRDDPRIKSGDGQAIRDV